MAEHDQASDAASRRDVRGVKIAFWVGVAAGLGHGIPRYGLFTLYTVNLVGVLVITTVSLYAAAVALLPSRATK